MIFKADKIEKPVLVQLQNSIKAVGRKLVKKGMLANHQIMVGTMQSCCTLFIIKSYGHREVCHQQLPFYLYLQLTNSGSYAQCDQTSLPHSRSPSKTPTVGALNRH